MQTGEAEKKSKGTHTREIIAFEQYFNTAYNPLQLSRTINEAALTLNEKIALNKQKPNYLKKYYS